MHHSSPLLVCAAAAPECISPPYMAENAWSALAWIWGWDGCQMHHSSPLLARAAAAPECIPPPYMTEDV